MKELTIGIDASRAFLHERTGIEEYGYQVVKHLREPLQAHNVVLYLRKGTKENIDFDVPETWRVKELWAPRLWTYLRLSLELLIHPIHVLLVPTHIVPPIHPKRTVAVIHGLEYEFCPDAYSWWEQVVMRFGIKKSSKWSRWIVSVSNNTKRDLMQLYDVPQEKMKVVYEGVNEPPISDSPSQKYAFLEESPYMLFIGRLEERKNIANIVRAYDIMREHFGLPHKLVLVGKPGYGWEKIEDAIEHSEHNEDIILTGFVTDQEKWGMLMHADLFLFPTLYEGFGLPVLEAQSVGVPVVTSEHSSLTEIVRLRPDKKAGQTEDAETLYSALTADPDDPADIAEKSHAILSDDIMRDALIKRGYDNVERFSWERCGKLIAKLLLHRTKGKE